MKQRSTRDIAHSQEHLLSDYYRCAAIPIACPPPEKLETHPGYFRFGEDAICYGRIANGSTSRSPISCLYDAFDEARCDGQEIHLPFDAEEIVENLRRERYSAHFREEGSVSNELLRKAYYRVRPLLGVPVRRHLQKLRLRGWEQIRFPAWPVDTTIERIHQQLLSLVLNSDGVQEIPFIWFWPDGFSNCAIMTHDVEDPAGRDFCSSLMDLDESAGIRSSFQIVPEKRYAVSQAFLRSITSRGFEVNVHDLRHDGRLYAEHAEFLRRAKLINHYIREYGAKGFRSGILYRNADWYDAFDFLYDMSIPNVGHLDPQRGGCCTVMPYFIGNIVELPLTCTQDYTLFQILGDYSLELWRKQISVIRENHGLMSFIVHPDYVMEQRAQKTYKALLSYLSRLAVEENVWLALPMDVAHWWRQRSQMQIVHQNGDWHVSGVGAERARVAYAQLDGKRVVYRVGQKPIRRSVASEKLNPSQAAHFEELLTNCSASEPVS